MTEKTATEEQVNLLQCDECPKISKSLRGLAQHKAIHTRAREEEGDGAGATEDPAPAPPAKAAAPKRRNTKRQTIAAKKVTRAVKRAGSPAARRELLEAALEDAEDVEIAVEEDNRPGRHIGGEKVAWQESDLLERWDVVSFMPAETVPISFNGIRYQLIAGQEMHVPEVIVRLYNEHVRAKVNPSDGVFKDTGFQTIVQLGAGPLGPDPAVTQ